MSERVELASPFAVVENDGQGGMVCEYETAEAARAHATKWDEDHPGEARHIVVRLTAERVEEPMPEAKSGWEWRVRRDEEGDIGLERRFPEGWCHVFWAVVSGAVRPNWAEFVPPCDHAHVAALLRREGVAQTPTISSSISGVTASHFSMTTSAAGGAQSCNLAGCTGHCGICNKGVEDD